MAYSVKDLQVSLGVDSTAVLKLPSTEVFSNLPDVGSDYVGLSKYENAYIISDEYAPIFPLDSGASIPFKYGGAVTFSTGTSTVAFDAEQLTKAIGEMSASVSLAFEQMAESLKSAINCFAQLTDFAPSYAFPTYEPSKLNPAGTKRVLDAVEKVRDLFSDPDRWISGM